MSEADDLTDLDQRPLDMVTRKAIFDGRLDPEKVMEDLGGIFGVGPHRMRADHPRDQHLVGESQP